MSNDTKITPFKEFLDSVEKTKPEAFAPAVAGTKPAATAEALTQMRAHILKHYEGVESQHSFVDANGSVFDCIPVEQQAGLRGKGSAAKPVDAPHAGAAAHATSSDAERKAEPMASPLGEGKKDHLGNVMNCPEGTIPMRRLTLEDMSRFESLQKFFQKSPLGNEVKPPQAASPAVAATHRWAHAYQNVNNLGGHSILNVWDPGIGANQVFSLSQQWYVGGSGANLQTAEVGWQVYPGLYGGTKPVFFIYWTADGYNKTGCYNLSCSNFVQTNKSWTIGGALSPSSVYGGAQYQIDVSYYLTGGNWWLYVGGGAASNAIGYYKASQYGSGALSNHAAEVDYGGEVVGTTSWPGMGSGHFPTEGWTKAAYQHTIQYFPTTGGVSDASLTAAQATPQCYKATVIKYAPSWSESLYFGGPGGTNC